MIENMDFILDTYSTKYTRQGSYMRDAFLIYI